MIDYKFFNDNISVLRVNNDSNGNPRYVIHYLNVSRKIKAELGESVSIFDDYIQAVAASGCGFRKFHNKQYGGGIVFQSYNVQSDLKHLERNVLNYIEKFKKSLNK